MAVQLLLPSSQSHDCQHVISTGYEMAVGGQRKTAIISFGITRGESINCCVPDERFRDLKQPKENTICE